jgi:hypothetical protein
MDYSWEQDRPVSYDPDKVWDEETKAWVTVDGRGGSRFSDIIVAFGRNNSGNCDIFVNY